MTTLYTARVEVTLHWPKRWSRLAEGMYVMGIFDIHTPKINLSIFKSSYRKLRLWLTDLPTVINIEPNVRRLPALIWIQKQIHTWPTCTTMALIAMAIAMATIHQGTDRMAYSKAPQLESYQDILQTLPWQTRQKMVQITLSMASHYLRNTSTFFGQGVVYLYMRRGENDPL